MQQIAQFIVYMNFVSSDSKKSAYLGKHAHGLLLKSSEQVETVYRMRGLIIPVIVSSVLQFLSEKNGSSLTEIARALDLPHQLISQRVKKLMALSLLERHPDEFDGRRFGYFLNKKGLDQAEKLTVCMQDMALIYEDLYEEIACDLPQKLLEAMASLDNYPLIDRFVHKFPLHQAG